jgi:phosphoglycerate dehydrogenase-like enzyme
MVLGIVGTSASAYAVAIRSLAFRMNVIYFDPLEVTVAFSTFFLSFFLSSSVSQMA